MPGELSGFAAEPAAAEGAAVKTEGAAIEPGTDGFHAGLADGARIAHTDLPAEPIATHGSGEAASEARDLPADPAGASEPRDEGVALAAPAREHADLSDPATREEALEHFYDRAANGEIPSDSHGVVLWSGGEYAAEAASQIAAERTSGGDRTITIGDTPMGREMDAAETRVKELSDPDAYRQDWGKDIQPGWTQASQRLVASSEGRIDVVVTREIPQDRVLQAEVIKAWNHECVSEIRFHEVEMHGGQPVRDGDGRIATRELMRRDW